MFTVTVWGPGSERAGTHHTTTSHGPTQAACLGLDVKTRHLDHWLVALRQLSLPWEQRLATLRRGLRQSLEVRPLQAGMRGVSQLRGVKMVGPPMKKQGCGCL